MSREGVGSLKGVVFVFHFNVEWVALPWYFPLAFSYLFFQLYEPSNSIEIRMEERVWSRDEYVKIEQDRGRERQTDRQRRREREREGSSVTLNEKKLNGNLKGNSWKEERLTRKIKKAMRVKSMEYKKKTKCGNSSKSKNSNTSNYLNVHTNKGRENLHQIMSEKYKIKRKERQYQWTSYLWFLTKEWTEY